jgi:hypothetical protein
MLCMNIIFKDGTGKSESAVYKGATAKVQDIISLLNVKFLCYLPRFILFSI